MSDIDAAPQESRTFLLTPKDRQGVVLGLDWAQIAAFGGASLLSILLLMAGGGLFVSAVPAVCGAVLAYGRWRGLPLVGWLGVIAHHLNVVRRGRQWVGSAPFDGSAGDLPGCLSGLRIDEEAMEGKEIGMVQDLSNGRVSAVLEVTGADFLLLAEEEQLDMLEGWGRVLGAHAVEGAPVKAISWTQIASRGSLRDHISWIQSLKAERNKTAARSYRQLVDNAAPRTTRHTTYLTVTVGDSGRSGEVGSRATREDALRTSLRAVERSLTTAELRRWRILDAAELRQLLSECCDPTTRGGLAKRVGDLAERVGVSDEAGCGPSETWTDWAWFETDRCGHVTFLVEDWPRHPARGDWMTLFLATGQWARRMHVTFEPVPAYDAHKKIERQAFKLDSDRAQREESGRRIGAAWRQAREGVERREEELVAGYSEMAYYGLVTVSATDGTTLDDAVAGVLDATRTAGVTVRPLVGEQDLAWAASLPFGLQAKHRILSQ